MTPEEMTQEASAATSARMVKHNKHASATNNAKIEAAFNKIDVPDGNTRPPKVLEMAEKDKEIL